MLWLHGGGRAALPRNTHNNNTVDINNCLGVMKVQVATENCMLVVGTGRNS